MKSSRLLGLESRDVPFALFNQVLAYDRMGELLLCITLAADLATIVGTTTRVNRFKALGLFLMYSMYYVFVSTSKLNDVSETTSTVLNVTGSIFWWFSGTAIAYYEFSQFIAIVKAVRPSQAYIAEVARMLITVALFVDGFFLALDYLASCITLPAMFQTLILVNLIQSAVCIPRMLSTGWILYLIKDIAKISNGVVRKLGMNYVAISGFQLIDGLLGVILMLSDMSRDSRLVSLVGCIELILLHYSICRMLASEISKDEGTTS
ncbi:hypothetical protein HDV06_006265 [Boothiomyces sp. JEL0866]|nr:hypothetical protein HDV06_006265 [Boothiomyces sp. JEL0866]